MAQLTFDDYKKAILRQFKLAIVDDYTGALSSPTPAALRDFCLMVHDRGLNGSDENIFRMFFGVSDKENLRKGIEQFNIGKFKSVIDFVSEEKNSQKKAGIELSAILCDFKPRPYGNFIRLGGKPETDLPKLDSESVEKKEEKSIENQSVNRENTIAISLHPKRKIYIGIGLTLSFLIGITLVFYNKKNCLTWKTDHYELVECEGNYPLKGYDEKLLNFKKIKVSDTTTFFKNGQPIVWYSRDNGFEYFNADGTHPVTGKELKPITTRIIQSQILKKQRAY